MLIELLPLQQLVFCRCCWWQARPQDVENEKVRCQACTSMLYVPVRYEMEACRVTVTQLTWEDVGVSPEMGRWMERGGEDGGGAVPSPPLGPPDPPLGSGSARYNPIQRQTESML